MNHKILFFFPLVLGLFLTVLPLVSAPVSSEWTISPEWTVSTAFSPAVPPPPPPPPVIPPITPSALQVDPVDISQFPQRLSDAMNLPLIAGQLLASCLVLALFLLPTLLLTNKYQSQSMAVLIVGICVMGFLVAATWLPYWFLLVFVLIVALMYSGKMRDFLGGS